MDKSVGTRLAELIEKSLYGSRAYFLTQRVFAQLCVIYYPRDVILARVLAMALCPCLCLSLAVCLLQVGVPSKGMDGLICSWHGCFLRHSLL